MAGRLAFYGLPLGVLGIVVAAVETAIPDGGGWTIFKAVVGAVLVAEGLLLASDWQHARRGAALRLQRYTGRTGRFWGWVLRPALFLLGLVCLGIGVLEVVKAIQDAV
jgi:hypothetical protein